MFTIAICLSFISVYSLYALSGKVEIDPKGVMLFLKTRKTLARLLAGSTFSLSTLILIWQMGFAVGIYTSLMFWMLLASFMILIVPFQKVKWPHLILGIAVIVGIELSSQFL